MELNGAQLPDDLGSARAFLYRMAFNLANDHRRAAQRRGVRDNDCGYGHLCDRRRNRRRLSRTLIAPLDARRQVARLMATLDELSPKCRESLFAPPARQGLSRKEVAQTLGITTKTVEKRMTAALVSIWRLPCVEGANCEAVERQNRK